MRPSLPSAARLRAGPWCSARSRRWDRRWGARAACRRPRNTSAPSEWCLRVLACVSSPKVRRIAVEKQKALRRSGGTISPHGTGLVGTTDLFSYSVVEARLRVGTLAARGCGIGEQGATGEVALFVAAFEHASVLDHQAQTSGEAGIKQQPFGRGREQLRRQHFAAKFEKGRGPVDAISHITISELYLIDITCILSYRSPPRVSRTPSPSKSRFCKALYLCAIFSPAMKIAKLQDNLRKTLLKRVDAGDLTQ